VADSVRRGLLQVKRMRHRAAHAEAGALGFQRDPAQPIDSGMRRLILTLDPRA